MLYVFIGPSCTGKSYMAEQIEKVHKFEIVTGKDYQRLAKNENIAWKLLMKKMKEAEEALVFERFSSRMGRELPPPVEQMLKKQLQSWKEISSDLVVCTSEEEDWVEKILSVK